MGKDLGGGEEGVTLIPIKVEGKIDESDVSFYTKRYLDREKQYLRNLLKKTISLPSKVVETITPDKPFQD